MTRDYLHKDKIEDTYFDIFCNLMLLHVFSCKCTYMMQPFNVCTGSAVKGQATLLLLNMTDNN